MSKKLVLDMGCGTKSLEPVCDELGLDYYSIDIDPAHEPDMISDILILEAREIPVKPWAIWFSPPCTCFSIASVGTHWTVDNSPKTSEASLAFQLVLNGRYIIRQLNPDYWFMENPRGKLRTLLDGSLYTVRHTVTYCQYGDTRMKPTDIWTDSLKWTPRPMCKNGDPCHEAAPRGSKTGTQGMSKIEAGRVPYALLKEILLSCMENK